MVINIASQSRVGGDVVDAYESARALLRKEMTVAEWIGLAVIVNAPYAIVGVAWALLNADRFAGLAGIPLVLSVVGSVLAWPLLLFGICTV
jgi:hypothetical protein